MKEKISITLNKKIIQEIDGIVDNVFIRNRSQAIEYLVNNALGQQKTAVILVGGPLEKLRINGQFKITAKAGNLTVVELAVKKLRENGFKKIFVVGKHPILTAVFDVVKEGSRYGVSINYVEEIRAEGSAESLKYLRGKIRSSFLVVFGDIIFERINIQKLWEDHIKQRGIATLMLTTSATPSKKGVVKVEGNKILEFIQKPKTTDIYLGFSSIFAAEPEILEYEGKSLEYDVFPKLAEKGLLIGHLSSEKEIHINTLEDLRNANKKC
ncbi:hypothetical protein D6745_03760 [Candidatus Woesearchaeota archaeon]|nr:MAG: hypothetical protein D6745_03760 [Candidatus Woesearchaeota archaeon]